MITGQKLTVLKLSELPETEERNVKAEPKQM